MQDTRVTRWSTIVFALVFPSLVTLIYFVGLAEQPAWLQLPQGPVAAICISSLGFMAHHVILLATFFSWSSPWTYLFSFSVVVGGAGWAWLYERDGSLYGPWISHLFVDAAIFLIGYDICRDLFT